jgi:hypothetical protein
MKIFSGQHGLQMYVPYKNLILLIRINLQFKIVFIFALNNSVSSFSFKNRIKSLRYGPQELVILRNFQQKIDGIN